MALNGYIKRQRRRLIYNFVREYSEQHKYPPTIREMREATGLNHVQASAALEELVGRGMLRVTPNHSIRKYVVPGMEDVRSSWIT